MDRAPVMARSHFERSSAVFAHTPAGWAAHRGHRTPVALPRRYCAVKGGQPIARCSSCCWTGRFCNCACVGGGRLPGAYTRAVGLASAHRQQPRNTTLRLDGAPRSHDSRQLHRARYFGIAHACSMEDGGDILQQVDEAGRGKDPGPRLLALLEDASARLPPAVLVRAYMRATDHLDLCNRECRNSSAAMRVWLDYARLYRHAARVRAVPAPWSCGPGRDADAVTNCVPSSHRDPQEGRNVYEFLRKNAASHMQGLVAVHYAQFELDCGTACAPHRTTASLLMCDVQGTSARRRRHLRRRNGVDWSR